jgi:hypothetical protein
MDMIESSCSGPQNYEPGRDIANFYVELAIKTTTKILCRPLLFLDRHPSPGHFILVTIHLTCFYILHWGRPPLPVSKDCRHQCYDNDA